jgi:hypothetical protein
MSGAKQAAVATDRTEAIVNTCDTMLDSYEHWKDHEVSIQPQTVFADHLDLLTVTYQHGSVPEKCRELMPRIGRVVEEWREYGLGNHSGLEKQEPLDSFHAAIESLAEARATIDVEPSGSGNLSAEELLAQNNGQGRQVAKAFGRRQPNPETGESTWVGPFFYKWTQTLDSHALKTEITNPGSVLEWADGRWIPPWADEDLAARKAAQSLRLERVRKRASDARQSVERRAYRPTEAEVVAYCREEKAFPRMVLAEWPSCGLTEADVVAMLNRVGIQPATKEDPVVRDLDGEPVPDEPPADLLETDSLIGGKPAFDAVAFAAKAVEIATELGVFDDPPRAKSTAVDEALRKSGDWDTQRFSAQKTASVLHYEKKRRAEKPGAPTTKPASADAGAPDDG